MNLCGSTSVTVDKIPAAKSYTAIFYFYSHKSLQFLKKDYFYTTIYTKYITILMSLKILIETFLNLS